MQVAQRDVARLGNEPDPLAVPLLERFGEELRRAPRTRSRLGDVRAAGTGRRSAAQGYPAHLALWSAQGALVDELVLDSLDLPPSLLSTMVRGLRPATRSGSRRCSASRACTTC